MRKTVVVCGTLTVAIPLISMLFLVFVVEQWMESSPWWNLLWLCSLVVLLFFAIPRRMPPSVRDLAFGFLILTIISTVISAVFRSF